MITTFRKSQWVRLTQQADRFQGHRVMLADHNSLIVPARDADFPAEEKKWEILAARDTKVAALQTLVMHDAWCEVHNLSTSDH